MNNKLILRTLVSPFTTPYEDQTKGSTLSWDDMDNNFIYLKGQSIYSASTENGVVTLNQLNGSNITFSAGTSSASITGGTFSSPTLTLTRDDGTDVVINGITTSVGNQLLSGGASYLSGLTFNVTSLTYIIDNVYYTAATSTVIVASGDSSFDRIDVIVVDISGNTSVVQGTPAINPIKPDIDEATQLEVTFITVAMGATTIALSSTLVYAEKVGPPTEWTFTTPSSPYISGNSTTASYSGTCSIALSAATTAKYFTLSSSTVFDSTVQNTIQFAIKNKIAWTSGVRLRFTILSSSGVQVGTYVDLYNGRFGFSTSNITTWQLLSIPLSYFALTTTLFSQIRVTTVNTSPQVINCYIDNVRMVEGIPSVTPNPSWLNIRVDNGTSIPAMVMNDTLILSGGTNIGSRLVSPRTIVFDLDNSINVNSISASTAGIGVTPFSNGLRMGASVPIYFDGGQSSIYNSGDSLVVNGYNKLVFNTNSTNAMYIDNTQNIGVGTITPSARLHIKGATADGSTNALKIVDSGNTAMLTTSNDGITTIVGKKTGTWNFGWNNGEIYATGNLGGSSLNLQSSNTNNYVAFGNGGGAPYVGWNVGRYVDDFKIDGYINGAASPSNILFIEAASGNVGVNKSTPTAKLHIKGTGSTYSTYGLKVENSASTVSFAVSDSGYSYINDLQIGANGGYGTLSVYGNQGASSDIVRFYAGGNHACNFEFRSAGNNGLLYVNDSLGQTQTQINGAVGGANYFKGSVGVGVTAPSALLHVSGDTLITNDDKTYRFNNNQLTISASGSGISNGQIKLVGGATGGNGHIAYGDGVTTQSLWIDSSYTGVITHFDYLGNMVVAKNSTAKSSSNKKVSIYGDSSDTSAHALKIYNFASSELFSVRNDGYATTTPASASTIALGGSFCEFTTTGQNSGSADTILHATSGITTTANLFKRTGDKLKGVFSGVFTGANTATKRIRVNYFGFTEFDSGAMSLTNDNNWRLEFTIMAVDSSSTVRLEFSFTTQDPTAGTSYTQLYTDVITGMDFTVDTPIILKGQSSGVGAATGDIQAKIGYIEYVPGRI